MTQYSETFFHQAFALRGAVTKRVMPRVLAFAALAVGITVLATARPSLGISVGPHEVSGAVLALLLVLRTNAGHDRWWEARKLWGGIVNQSRNFAIGALAYGPNDAAWRTRIARWTALFPHVARQSLRSDRTLPEAERLVGQTAARAVIAAQHMPGYVASVLAALLHEGYARGGMDHFAFLQVDRERAALIDHIGGCERILKTPLPRVYAIKVRRFIVLYLATLPFALVPKLGWLTPLVTMLVAYPVLAVDQIGEELQNPFALRSLSHLPLHDIGNTIETNVLALLAGPPDAAVLESDPPMHPGERALDRPERSGDAPGLPLSPAPA